MYIDRCSACNTCCCYTYTKPLNAVRYFRMPSRKCRFALIACCFDTLCICLEVILVIAFRQHKRSLYPKEFSPGNPYIVRRFVNGCFRCNCTIRKTCCTGCKDVYISDGKRGCINARSWRTFKQINNASF